MSELTKGYSEQLYHPFRSNSANDCLDRCDLRPPKLGQGSHQAEGAQPISSITAVSLTPPLSRASIDDLVTPNNQILLVDKLDHGRRHTTCSTVTPESILSPLPSISPTYFCQDPPEVTKQRDCFIFYDPELKLPPQPIRPSDFNKSLPERQPEQTTKVRESSHGRSQSQQLSAPVKAANVNNHDIMGKPVVSTNEVFNNQTAIKQKITLSDKDYKALQNTCFTHVIAKESLCKPVPRQWKQKWIGITEDFLEKDGYGESYFNSKRVNYEEDSSLLWPEDKDAITFLVFNLLKQQASKAFSNRGATKRKSLLSNESTSAAKKSKTDTPSVTGSHGTSKDISPADGNRERSSEPASSDSTEDENDEEEDITIAKANDEDMSESDQAEGDVTVDRAEDDGNERRSEEGLASLHSGIMSNQPNQASSFKTSANVFPAKPTEAFNPSKIVNQGGIDAKVQWPILGSSFPNQQSADSVSYDHFPLQPGKQGFGEANSVSGHHSQVPKARKAASLPPLAYQLRNSTQSGNPHDINYHEFLDMPKTPQNHLFDQGDLDSGISHTAGLAHAEEGRANLKAAEEMVIKSNRQGKNLVVYSRHNERGQQVDPIYMPAYQHLQSGGASSPISSILSAKIEMVYSIRIKHAVKQSHRLVTVSSDASFYYCYGRFIVQSRTDEDRIALATAKTCMVLGPGNLAKYSFPIALPLGEIEPIWKSVVKKLVALTGPGCPNEGDMVELEFGD